MMTANYFANFDSIVMRAFVADVLDAFNVFALISAKRARSFEVFHAFNTLSVAQRFALALEAVRIMYDIDSDDATRALTASIIVMRDALKRADYMITLEALANAKLNEYDVHSFAVAAYSITTDASLN